MCPPPSSQGQDDDVEVRREDQKAINTFGRLNGRLHELEEERLRHAQSRRRLPAHAHARRAASDRPGRQR